MDLRVTQKGDGVTLYEGQETAQDYSNFSIIPAWIMKHPKLQANDKLVYSLIFSFNTNSKTFFASNAFIAASLNISVPTVQRILANLEKLELVYRKLENGHRTSVTARLIDNTPPISQMMPPISSAIPTHITDDTPPYHLRYHTNKDTKKETNKYIKSNDQFEEFWKKYPRKIGKAKAVIKYPTEEHTAILAGLERAINFWSDAETDVKFIPHPATWLNQRRWEDEF